MSSSVLSSQAKPEIAAIWRTGMIATAIATVINAVLYLVGSLFTFPPEALTNMGQPVTLLPVVLITFIGGVLATAGYTVLTRFLERAKANLTMLVVTGLLLVGMFFTPFGITNVPVAEIIILEIMHIVAAYPVWALTRPNSY